MAKHDRVVTGLVEVPRRPLVGALAARGALVVRVAVLSLLSLAAVLGTVPVAATGALAAGACLFGVLEVRALRAGRDARRPQAAAGRTAAGTARPVLRLA